MTTTTARMTVRKGNLADMPKLLPGEFGLATDIQRLFIGQATVNGTCQVSNSDATTAKVEFTSANGDPIDLDLIANLDPLDLQIKEEHQELKPETYGFKKQDYNRKIFLDGVLGLQYGNLNEIIKILKKTYCSTIGYEFMHMSDPEEKAWVRNRIEGPEKAITFTDNGKKAILNKIIENPLLPTVAIPLPLPPRLGLGLETRFHCLWGTSCHHSP